MVDPTTRTECPACGHAAPTNQMGQTYGHSGINGCPYAGTGPVERQLIYPLKFDYLPIITATAAYMDDGLAATIRFALDPERRPAAGEYISLRTVEDEVFGIARVEEDRIGTVKDVARDVWRSKARYPHDSGQQIVDVLNGYYEDDIDLDTEVFAILYAPHITDCYRKEPPALDRL